MTMALARTEILSEVLSFPTIPGRWIGDVTRSMEPVIGDLVSLYSCRPNKFYLSWVEGVRPETGEYLLRSIEDGSESWWSNVGFNIYSRDLVRENPQWKWTDSQFAFFEKCKAACSNVNHIYIRPKTPIFHENGAVTLDVDIYMELTQFDHPKKFNEWEKLTGKQLESYYREAADKYDLENKE